MRRLFGWDRSRRLHARRRLGIKGQASQESISEVALGRPAVGNRTQLPSEILAKGWRLFEGKTGALYEAANTLKNSPHRFVGRSKREEDSRRKPHEDRKRHSWLGSGPAVARWINRPETQRSPSCREVNPVIAESVTMVCAKFGNDVTSTSGDRPPT